MSNFSTLGFYSKVGYLLIQKNSDTLPRRCTWSQIEGIIESDWGWQGLSDKVGDMGSIEDERQYSIECAISINMGIGGGLPKD